MDSKGQATIVSAKGKNKGKPLPQDGQIVVSKYQTRWQAIGPTPSGQVRFVIVSTATETVVSQSDYITTQSVDAVNSETDSSTLTAIKTETPDQSKAKAQSNGNQRLHGVGSKALKSANDPISTSDLNTAAKDIDQFLSNGHTTLEKDIGMLNLARQAKVPREVVLRLISRKEAAVHINEADFAQLERSLALSETELDWAFILPELYEPILAQAKEDCADPIGYVQYLFAATMAQTSRETSLRIRDGFHIPPVIWTLIVSPSGSGKSRFQKGIIKPLMTLQAVADEACRLRYEDYERQKQQAKQQRKNGAAIYEEQDPEKPDPRQVFILQNSTPEAMWQTLADQDAYDGSGILWNADEILSIFQSLGAYNSSATAGDGYRAEILATWDQPEHHSITRKSEFVSIIKPSISLAGGIQPGKIKDLLRDMTDAQGFGARFLWAAPKFVPMQLPDYETESVTMLQPVVSEVFRNVRRLLPHVYQFRKEGYEAFREAYNGTDQRARQESNPALATWMMKIPGHLGRLILVLHTLDLVTRKDYVERLSKKGEVALVSANTVERAIALLNYYQHAYQSCLSSQSSYISKDTGMLLCWLWQQCDGKERNNWELARANRGMQERAKELNMSGPEYVEILMQALAERGRGKIRYERSQIWFKSKR